MYSYQSTSQQQQQHHYSPPPPGAEQYAQPSPYGQPPVNNPGGYGGGASQYASTSGYPGQQQQSPPYGQHQQQSAPAYGAEASYGGGYGQSAPVQAPMYGSSGYGSSAPPVSPPPPPTPQYQQQQQQPYYQSSYSPPPPPAPSYAQPPPQPPQAVPGPSLPYDIGTDQNVFRNYFSHELKQLTFNSKPMINGLTILAHEHATRMAPIVCQCLEEHIRQTHPTTKLPAMYLLDSICKNIGPPYTSLFSRTIDRIFLAAYHDVDPQTKVKLEELLGTWRTGGQDGGELFKLLPNSPMGSLPPQRIIEDALFSRPPPSSMPTAPVAMPPPPFQQHNGAPSFNRQSPPPPVQAPSWQPRPPTPPKQQNGTSNLEKAEVLFDIRKMLELRRSQLVANPHNRSNLDQINTLKQLELLVTNTVLDTAQIAQIREQLAKISPKKAGHGNSPKNETDHRGGKRQRLMSPSQQQQYPPRGTPPLSSGFDLAALASRLNPDIIRTASAQGSRSSVTPPPSSGLPSGAGLPMNPMSRLSNSTLPGTATPPVMPAGPAQADIMNANAFAAYEHHRVHFTVQLQSSDIARYRPGSQALLYDAMPLRCGQCGNRYLDCPLGKERLDRDLDRHLRISRRYTEGVGAQRGIARAWFTVEEEWVLPPSKIQPSAAVVQADMAKAKAEHRAELLNKFVMVPPTAATDEEISRCPICKETFQNEYSEEEEDWVWRNCVEIDGKYYHASCKAEQDE